MAATITINYAVAYYGNVILTPQQPPLEKLTLSDWRAIRERAEYATGTGVFDQYRSSAWGRDGSACLAYYAAIRRFRSTVVPIHEERSRYSTVVDAVGDRIYHSMWITLQSFGCFRLGKETIPAINRIIAQLEEHEVPADKPVEPTKPVYTEPVYAEEKGELVCV